MIRERWTLRRGEEVVGQDEPPRPVPVVRELGPVQSRERPSRRQATLVELVHAAIVPSLQRADVAVRKVTRQPAVGPAGEWPDRAVVVGACGTVGAGERAEEVVEHATADRARMVAAPNAPRREGGHMIGGVYRPSPRASDGDGCSIN